MLYRVTLLGAMLSILWLAASVGGIGVEPTSMVSFVLAYSADEAPRGRALRQGLDAMCPTLRPFVGFYAAGNTIGAGIWLSSLLVPAPVRYVLWASALLVELVAPDACGARAFRDPDYAPRVIPSRATYRSATGSSP